MVESEELRINTVSEVHVKGCKKEMGIQTVGDHFTFPCANDKISRRWSKSSSLQSESIIYEFDRRLSGCLPGEEDDGSDFAKEKERCGSETWFLEHFRKLHFSTSWYEPRKIVCALRRINS